jgi:carbon monoxide dehydrogenase subunit G
LLSHSVGERILRMPEISTSEIIDAPAESVWTLLADFPNIKAWWPTDGAIRIDRVECEGEGIGMVRHVYNVGVKGCVSERLDFLDIESRTLMLSIVGNRPGGITAYVATARVVELDPKRCRVDYRANLTTEPGREAQAVKSIRFTWALMFKGLQAKAAGTDT